MASLDEAMTPRRSGAFCEDRLTVHTWKGHLEEWPQADPTPADTSCRSSSPWVASAASLLPEGCPSSDI